MCCRKNRANGGAGGGIVVTAIKLIRERAEERRALRVQSRNYIGDNHQNIALEVPTKMGESGFDEPPSYVESEMKQAVALGSGQTGSLATYPAVAQAPMEKKSCCQRKREARLQQRAERQAWKAQGQLARGGMVKV